MTEHLFKIGQIVIHRPDAGWPVRSKNRTCVILEGADDTGRYRIRPLRGAGADVSFTCIGGVLEVHQAYRERDGFDRIVARACTRLDSLQAEIEQRCQNALARIAGW